MIADGFTVLDEPLGTYESNITKALEKSDDTSRRVVLARIAEIKAIQNSEEQRQCMIRLHDFILWQQKLMDKLLELRKEEEDLGKIKIDLTGNPSGYTDDFLLYSGARDIVEGLSKEFVISGILAVGAGIGIIFFMSSVGWGVVAISAGLVFTVAGMIGIHSKPESNKNKEAHKPFYKLLHNQRSGLFNDEKYFFPNTSYPSPQDCIKIDDIKRHYSTDKNEAEAILQKAQRITLAYALRKIEDTLRVISKSAQTSFYNMVSDYFKVDNPQESKSNENADARSNTQYCNFFQTKRTDIMNFGVTEQLMDNFSSNIQKLSPFSRSH